MDDYTPGTWRWVNFPNGHKILISRHKAVIYTQGPPMEVGEADMRLIAAAPDLLRELEALCEACESDNGFKRQVAYARVVLNRLKIQAQMA